MKIRQDYTEIGDGGGIVKATYAHKGGLSVIFAIMCIIDLFGVFPVITLPKSVIACGIYGIPLVVSVIGLQLYTAVLLGRCWLLAQEITPHIKQKSRYPYAAVGELAFGRVGRRTVTILLNATVFGSGIPNFILAAQSLQLFWFKITDGGVAVTYCVWMLLLALLLCPVMWLGSPKDMKPIACASVLIVLTVAASIWSCISLDDSSPPSAKSVLDHQPTLRDFLSAYGIMAFQFDIHPMLLTIQVDMRDGRQVNKAVAGGFLATLGMFAVTALLAADRYGMAVDSNILQGIPPSIPLYMVALLVTLQLCLSSAVGNSVLFQQIEDYFRIPTNFCWQRVLIRSTIVILAVFLAEAVPRFDLVMGVVGSTLTGPLMFIFPPIFFIRLCYIKSHMAKDPLKFGMARQNGGGKGSHFGGSQINGDASPLIFSHSQTKYKTFTSRLYNNIFSVDDDYTISWYDVVLALVVMSMGIAATVVATYSSWATSIQYASYSPPCLINASIAAGSFLFE